MNLCLRDQFAYILAWDAVGDLKLVCLYPKANFGAYRISMFQLATGCGLI